MPLQKQKENATLPRLVLAMSCRTYCSQRPVKGEGGAASVCGGRSAPLFNKPVPDLPFVTANAFFVRKEKKVRNKTVSLWPGTW